MQTKASNRVWRRHSAFGERTRRSERGDRSWEKERTRGKELIQERERGGIVSYEQEFDRRRREIESSIERGSERLPSSIFERREIEQTVKSVSIKERERELEKKSRSKCTSALQKDGDGIADRKRHQREH